MDFISKLERKFGRFAIPNLTMYLIGGYVVGYLLYFGTMVTKTDLLSLIELEPYYILQGQIWRIISWVLMPPSSFSIFTIIMLILYYQLGSALERTWGVFRYNLYIFSGIFFTLIGAFVIYFILYKIYGQPVGIGTFFSTYYVNLSIFLAFAACYPDMQLMLYFLIPVKIKWLAYIDIAVLAYDFYRTSWPGRVAIIVSLLNFLLFFLGGMRKFKAISPGEYKRRRDYKKKVRAGEQARAQRTGSVLTKHTELDGDDLEFRFCSKCEGNYEYCQDHLFTHEHIKS